MRILTLLQLALALLISLIGSSAAAQATVTTTLVSGDPLLTSGTLTVAVSVTANSSGKAPISASLRVRFPEDALAWGTVTERDLGVPFASPSDEDGTPGDGIKFRDVITSGADPGSATNLTPVAFEVNFTVLSGAATVAPYQIVVEVDPDAGSEAIFWVDLSPPATGGITPLTFNNNAVSILSEDGWQLLND